MKTYQIENPIKVSKNNFEECSIIGIEEPNMMNLGNVTKLKDIIGKGMRNVAGNITSNQQAEEKQKNEDEDFDIMTLLMTFGITEEYTSEFKDFLSKRGTFQIDEKNTPAISGDINKMDMKDFIYVMSEYSKDFLFKGLLGD